MTFFNGQRVLNLGSFAPGNVSAVDLGKDFDGLIPPAHFHQPPGTFDRRQNHQSEQNRWYDTGEKHPAPACGDIPGFIAHALNEHVNEDSCENADHDAKLVKSHAAAANPGGSNLRDVVRRNHRRGADPHSADQPPENELMEIGGKNHANRRKSETKGTQRETLFLAEIVGNGSCRDAAGDASDQRASRGPADARCVQVKQLAQESNCAADDNVVVSKQKTAKRGDAGCDN